MNDHPTDAGAELRTLLTEGVPDGPALTGLAARAEAGARRTRRVRRVGAVLVVASVVAAVVVIPRLVGSGPHAAPTPTGPAAPATCVPQTALDHQDFRTGTAAWVLACPGTPARLSMPLPSLTLRRGAADLVGAWQEKAYVAAPFVSCPTAVYPSAIVEVGFTDGTIAAVGVSGCRGTILPGDEAINDGPVEFADAFSTAVHQEYQGVVRDVSGGGVLCPATPHPVHADGRSESALSENGALLNLPALTAFVCRYHDGRLVGEVRSVDANALLLASSSGWYLPSARDLAAVQAPVRRGLDDYVVVLGDRTGTVRTFTMTGRYGTVTFYRHRSHGDEVGYASPPMYVALHVGAP